MERKRRLTVQETAFELGVTIQHVYNLVNAGKIEAIDISESGAGRAHSLRVDSASLERFIEERKIDPQKRLE